MYSIIIQNQKTMEVFLRYQSIFAEGIQGDKMAMCKWIESGTTIDTALPELRNLIDDKEEWRAVVVRYIDDNPMGAFEHAPNNPYDFVINGEGDDTINDSPIPLIRLSYMLGGLPPLEKKFQTEVLKERNKAPRTIYTPIDDKQREVDYKNLAEKYKFDGKLPSSILFISVRRKNPQNEIFTDEVWVEHKESQSSEFWKRNKYPSMCRFMAYDVAERSSTEKEADTFSFWYSVMLMANNEWDASILQAYRLYRLGITIDKNEMEKAFQKLADQLRDARNSLEKSIKTDIEKTIADDVTLPDYSLNISVPIKLPSDEQFLVESNSFGVMSDGMITEGTLWAAKRREAEKNLSTSIWSVERTLNQTAEKIRDNCSYQEEEVTPLNKYQEEDLERETNELYRKIVDMQGKLVPDNVSQDEDVEKAATDVKKNLIGRVTIRAAILTYAMVNLLVVISFIPAFIRLKSIRPIMLCNMLCIATLIWVVIGIAIIIVLLLRKIKLNKLIHKYNNHISDAFYQLVENASDYSSYMTYIASHARGRSYLNISKNIKKYSSTEHQTKYKHIKAIDILLGKLNVWTKAYHLNVDFTSKRTENIVTVNVSISPLENKLYSFRAENAYTVAINNSGMTMNAPYKFASKIEIVREELYDV